MESFTFNKRQDVLIPEINNFKPFMDKDGNAITGARLIKIMAKTVDKWEKKNNMPVPIPYQKFIAWVKQAAKELENGKSSEEIFKRTIVPFR